MHPGDDTLPKMAHDLFRLQASEYASVVARLAEVDRRLISWHRADDLSRRIATIPGVGPIGYSQRCSGRIDMTIL